MSARRTSVSGASYVLHIPNGDHTICGRPVESVNVAAPDEQPSEGTCKSCASKLPKAPK